MKSNQNFPHPKINLNQTKTWSCTHYMHYMNKNEFLNRLTVTVVYDCSVQARLRAVFVLTAVLAVSVDALLTKDQEVSRVFELQSDANEAACSFLQLPWCWPPTALPITVAAAAVLLWESNEYFLVPVVDDVVVLVILIATDWWTSFVCLNILLFFFLLKVDYLLVTE